MLLKKLVVSGYKSISTSHPQTIEFEPDLTIFIGHNGTGKSAALEALNKLFSIDHSLRGILPSDFHLPDNVDAATPRSLMIETWFTLTNSEGNPSVPSLINGLTASSSTGEIIFRVRLEANLSYDFNPLGDVDESIWVIDGDMEEPEEEDKHRLSATQRNAIQVNYVPANRDPLVQLKYSSKAILGRLLKAIKWSDGEQDSFEAQAQQLNQLAADNPALEQITQAINHNWQDIYKGRHLNQAKLNFPVGDVDEILKLIQLQFMPDATGNKVDTSRLSDGQKSLVYFALTKALFDIDKATRQAIVGSQSSNFDVDKMKLPIFSLIVLEEPENHLSPHYLGRILKLVKDYASTEFCQSLVSTHSASLVGRIKPEQIRHFRLDSENICTKVQGLLLPEDSDEQAKYVSEAIKAYPEIYFAKLVILGEGDSEQVVLPKLLEHYGKDIDGHSISVIPLGGRHVNHFWRLLNSLKIPFVTLLDFDIDRNGGGFGRMKYVIEQLRLMDNNSTDFIYGDILDSIPAWNSPQSPTNFFVRDPDNVVKVIVDEIEKYNVFFSSPLDIDYSMICAFPEIFCEKDEAYGERGPTEGKEDEEDENTTKREAALIKAVLKKGNTGKRFNFGSNWERNFLWYRYRFLSNKSKPASHVRMFTKLEERYTSQEILEKLPSELTRLMERIVELSEQVVE
ncbi:TPA: AAA family ATPase [Vibrio alginolyticus]|uniref:ATP-dependent nuclease n=1 Tax=Vibrio parahaemolyticus TaxID=670 RepID=UPI0006B28A1A|nr:AAA family ATPase [Vibrio parahaemolyticus]EGQ8472048.1 AAA family ATPase [Vibrio alginolyticus]EJL6856202.1 AAA family ATPase [Vibrio alginolyticus]ELA9243890.1 AAA family ATPase [Vibrio alginolyticus]ELB2840599.1 AAA family ATPase [Vibrio alginolyticus]KOY37407.1 exonuclease [Vibrio parahaemolyticus]